MKTLITLSSLTLDKLKNEDKISARNEMMSDYHRLSRRIYQNTLKPKHVGRLATSIMVYCDATKREIDLQEFKNKPIKNSNAELLHFIDTIIQKNEYMQSMEIMDAIAIKNGWDLKDCIIKSLGI